MNKNAPQYSASVTSTMDSSGSDRLLNEEKNYSGSQSIEERFAVGLLCLGIIIFVVHFLFFRNSFPPVNVDEASFFSPAKSFATKGNLASDVHKSFLPGAGNYTYWMPPLYIVILGAFFKIFGSTVMAAKVLSLLLSCGSALLLASLATGKFSRLMVAALFLVCPFIIITSAFIRVEALAIFLTALAIVAVKRGRSDLLLGVIAALGVMTHPLMLACSAGLALTSLRKGIKPLLIFSLGFAVAISPYTWYILQDVALFKEQMALQFLRKAKASFFDLKPMYLLQSVPMALLALYCLYKTKAENSLRLFLAVSLLLSLLIVLRSNEFNYQVYLVPYTVASIALAMQYHYKEGLFRLVVPVVLAGVFSIILLSKLVKYKFRTDKDFTELITYLDSNPTWKGKTIFVGGGPDVASHLLMNGENVERQVPVPQAVSDSWFDKYNYTIEVKANGDGDLNEEEGKPRPWRVWKASSFTTADSAYTMTEYIRP